MSSLFYLQHAKAAYVEFLPAKNDYYITYLYRKKVRHVTVDGEEANLNQLSLFLSKNSVYICRNNEELLGLLKRPLVL